MHKVEEFYTGCLFTSLSSSKNLDLLSWKPFADDSDRQQMATLVCNVCKKEIKYCGTMLAYDALKSLLYQTKKKKNKLFC